MLWRSGARSRSVALRVGKTVQLECKGLVGDGAFSLAGQGFQRGDEAGEVVAGVALRVRKTVQRECNRLVRRQPCSPAISTSTLMALATRSWLGRPTAEPWESSRLTGP